MAIQIRRGTDSGWESNNSNIVAGEPAVATDTERFFVGVDSGEYMELSNINLIAPQYDSSATYNVGDYVIYQGRLYVCNTANTTGAWNSSKWNSISLKQALDDLTTRSVPTSVREAIYTLLNNCAYATIGLTDEIAVVQSWAEAVTSLTLSASSLSLSGSTPQTLIPTVVPSSASVSWSSSDNSIATVVGGVVTGVSNGSCVITASAGNLSANCSVTVSGFLVLDSISAVYTQSGTVYNIDTLNSLKDDLVVTAVYDDTSTETIASTDYSLSGTLAVGTSTITVTYSTKTTTFTVTVTDILPAEYQRVEYLVASQTNSTKGAYINTNVAFNNPTLATIRIGLQATNLSPLTTGAYAIGTRETGTGSTNRTGWTVGIGSSKVNVASWSGDPGPYYTPSDILDYFDIVATHTSTDMTLKVNDSDVVTSVQGTRGCSGYNIGLFGIPSLASGGGATHLFNGRIYYAEIEQDGTLIFSGIPCYQKSDSVPGFYDWVNSTFRSRSSSGGGSYTQITAGPDVV